MRVRPRGCRRERHACCRAHSHHAASDGQQNAVHGMARSGDPPWLNARVVGAWAPLRGALCGPAHDTMHTNNRKNANRLYRMARPRPKAAACGHTSPHTSAVAASSGAHFGGATIAAAGTSFVLWTTPLSAASSSRRRTRLNFTRQSEPMRRLTTPRPKHTPIMAERSCVLRRSASWISSSPMLSAEKSSLLDAPSACALSTCCRTSSSHSFAQDIGPI
mmetsp:Transcript_35230/g.101462  ORF Transcript_35230/g.101462 Transcript_35230/m.101462 type:complete len:219 (+) Transcript_35230:148-804(+)